MIGTVYFYSMKGSLSSGEYPLLTEGQDLSDYLITSVADIGFSADIQQSVTVPEFTGYENVNIVKMNGLYYWTTDFKQSAIYNGCIEFSLSLCAPTSFIKKNDTINAIWDRTPTYIDRFMQQDVIKSVLQPSRSIPMGLDMALPTIGNIDCMFWVQIMARGLGLIGFPVSFDLSNPLFANPNLFYDTDDVRTFPTLLNVLSSLSSVLGVTDDDIMDVSITANCPFYTSYSIENASDIKYSVGAGGITALTGNRVAYSVTAEPRNATLKYTITDNERLTGRSVIVGDGGNNVVTIPHEVSSYDDDTELNEISIGIRPYYDSDGLYTEFNINGILSSVTEGKLPWSSDSWQMYKSYQMNLDRQQMVNSNIMAAQDMIHQGLIDTYDYNRSKFTADVGAISQFSIMNLGISSLSSYIQSSRDLYFQNLMDSENRKYQYQRQLQQNAWDYEYKQIEAANQPNSINNLGYGFGYCYRHIYNPAHISVRIPYGQDDGIVSDYVNNFGYPANGVHSITATQGYYQCRLMNDGSLTGRYFDELNNTMMNGFKFVEIEQEVIS